MIRRLLPYFLLACFLGLSGVILFPCSCGSRERARRSSCQSNLKQIGLALREYAQDNDGRLPLRRWVAPLAVYAKTDVIFQCPSTPNEVGASDYFFNSHFLGRPLAQIASPQALVLCGDGQDGAPLNITLPQLPEAWRTDEASPAFRHMDTANYLFADGHVRSLKANRVSFDFRVVK